MTELLDQAERHPVAGRIACGLRQGSNGGSRIADEAGIALRHRQVEVASRNFNPQGAVAGTRCKLLAQRFHALDGWVAGAAG